MCKMIVFRLRNMTEPSPVVKNDNLKISIVTSVFSVKVILEPFNNPIFNPRCFPFKGRGPQLDTEGHNNGAANRTEPYDRKKVI